METINGSVHYIGKVKTFDTRYTNKPMTLNVLVESSYCQQEKKAILVFRFSQKEFENDVWHKLKSVNLSNTTCNH